MKNALFYKGYYGIVDYSYEDEIFIGKLLGIKDLVNFEAENAKEVKKEFESAVDDYLAICEELGDEPNKPFKGSFNIRIPSELHRKASIVSESKKISLNEFVKTAIMKEVESLGMKELENN